MAAIDFGIWDHFERRLDVEPPQQYEEKIKLLQAAERLGFYGYHLAEHHLTPLDVAPSPNLFLAAAAPATSRIRLGTMVHILPLYHPVRFLQEICMLDNLSDGRIDVGIGAGTGRSIEFRWFGQVNRLESRPLFDEILDIYTTCLPKGNLAYNGKYFQIEDAPLDMLPRQRPYPPLWYAAGDFAGRHGLNFFSRSFDDVAHYWERWEEARSSPDRLNPQVEVPKAGVTKHIVVRETEAEALKVARRAWTVFNQHWHATPLEAVGGRPSPAASVQDDFDQALASNTRLVVGTPATLRDYVSGFVERFKDRPSVYFAPAVQWGDMTHEEALETMTLFGKEVMPAFKSIGAPA